MIFFTKRYHLIEIIHLRRYRIFFFVQSKNTVYLFILQKHKINLKD